MIEKYFIFKVFRPILFNFLPTKGILMSKKDLTQKALLRLPDVFASLINFLIFDNCPVIHPNQICPLDIPVQFDYDSSLNPVYRDASAMVLDPDGHPSFIVNFENQTAHDPTMPVRAMGYTDTAYFWQRSQLIKSSRPSLPFSLSCFVPSLTIVLETVRFKLYNAIWCWSRDTGIRLSEEQ